MENYSFKGTGRQLKVQKFDPKKPPGNMDELTWKWVISMSPSQRNRNEDGSKKDSEIHGFGHSNGGVSEATGALILCMVILLILSTLYLFYRVYFCEGKRLTERWLQEHRPNALNNGDPKSPTKASMDNSHIENVNTSNALVDPESNRKPKPNKSNDKIVKEKDIKLEIVGEEVKEDDEQLQQLPPDSEYDQESDNDQDVPNPPPQNPQKKPQEQKKQDQSAVINKSQDKSLNASKQDSNTSQVQKKQQQQQPVEEIKQKEKQDQSKPELKKPDESAGPYNPKLEKSGVSRKSRGKTDDGQEYGSEYYDEEDDNQQSPEQFKQHKA